MASTSACAGFFTIRLADYLSEDLLTRLNDELAKATGRYEKLKKQAEKQAEAAAAAAAAAEEGAAIPQNPRTSIHMPSCISLIDNVLHQGNLSADEIALLRLIQLLLRGASGKGNTEFSPSTKEPELETESQFQVCIWALAQMAQTEQPLTTKALATLLYPRFKLDTQFDESNEELRPGVTKQAIDSLRVETWRAAPFVVIGVLLHEQRFPEYPKHFSFLRVPARTSEIAQYVLAVLSRDGVSTLNASEVASAVEEAIQTDNELADSRKRIVLPTEEELNEASEVVRAIRILTPLVQEDPEDILRLMGKNYMTVRRITGETIQSEFVDRMTQVGVSRENAMAIHRRANMIDCWNEHLWYQLMEARRRDGVPIVPRPNKAVVGKGDKEEPPLSGVNPRSKNNLTDIFLLEDAACETCCSVTSLSAYFADLMSLLDETTIRGTTGKTLLSILDDRRPDLKRLQLSCANSMTLVPYISLVNETLESFIRFHYEGSPALLLKERGTAASVIAYNTPLDAPLGSGDSNGGGGHEPVYQPGNTDSEVYSKIISKQMFPFTCFPYNQARDASAQILQSFNVAMPELTEAFRSTDSVLKGVPYQFYNEVIFEQVEMDASLRTSLERGVSEVHDRQQAAEVLGLQQAEFAAITGETFYPSWFADLVVGLSTDAETEIVSRCPWTAATLWGYDDLATMLDREKTLGLSFVKRQFMRRAGIEFQDVIDLAKTQCFGQDLVITNKTGSREFDGRLEDLRLLSGASSPPFRELGEDVCFRLQSFLRLKAKLGWSTKELDAAVYCLRLREMQVSTSSAITLNMDRKGFFTISVFVLKSLSAIVRISRLSGLEPTILLPFWGGIDTYGQRSLMFRRFFTPMMGILSNMFKWPGDGETLFQYRGQNALLTSEKKAICAGLQWPMELFDSLLQATDLSGSDIELNISSLSKLYRYVLLLQVLNVTPREAPLFFDLFFNHPVGTGQKNPLETPMATLVAIENWKQLFDSGWTLKALATAVGVTSFSDQNLAAAIPNSALELLSTITKGAKELHENLPYLYSEGPVSAENVVDCASRTFDATTSKEVVSFIEGTQQNWEAVTFPSQEDLRSALQAARKWPKKLSLIPGGQRDVFTAELRLAGVLTAKEHSWLKHGVRVPALLLAAFNKLVEKSVAERQVIKTRFKVTDVADSVRILLEDAEVNLSPENPQPDEHDAFDDSEVVIDTETLIHGCRRAFIDLAKPTIIREFLEKIFTIAVKALLPDPDTNLIPVLLSKVVQVPRKNAKEGEPEQQSVMDALRTVAESKDDVNSGSVDVFFSPPSTEIYTFSYGDEGQLPADPPSLEINGLSLAFDEKTRSWTPYRLAAGQLHHLEGDFPLSQLLWSTSKTPIPAAFHPSTLLLGDKSLRAAEIEAAIRRVGTICTVTRLSVNELESLQVNSGSQMQSILSLDFNAPTLEDLVRMHQYCDLRDRCIPPSRDANAVSVMELFSWISRTESATAETVSRKITSCTGWDRNRLVSLLEHKYPSHRETEAIQLKALRSFDALLALHRIMLIDRRLQASAGNNSSRPPISTLFNLAQPRRTLSAIWDAQAAEELQARLTVQQRAKADANLAENQRRALVTYLLQQPHVTQTLKILDADGLFEHLLIDVQMGPQLRTSRIKLAISVIQLFVQRCMLGLEKEVPKGTLSRENWDWRQQYSLWEAHRKIFLYPENWVDPSLRDDKSQLFDQFEAALMQKGLSLDTFRDAVKAYIYGLNEIARLEIVSYVHDSQGGTNGDDVFHLFGRTRVSPYSFYYRSLTVMHGPYGCFWRPWTRLDMDIPATDTEWEGKKLEVSGTYLVPVVVGQRLYLFMPHIVPKTLSNPQSMDVFDKKINPYGDKQAESAKPKRIWELNMAWTELVRGTWAPKRVCSTSLSIDEELPKVSEFRFEPVFDTDRSSNKVTLLVSHASTSDTKRGKLVGAFVFCEDQMHVTKSVTDTKPDIRPFDGCFQKVIMSSADRKSVARKLTELYSNGDADNRPLLWVPSALDTLDADAPSTRKRDSVSWTLSYSRDAAPLGLALSSQRKDGTNVGYFTVPHVQLLPTKRWVPEHVDNNMTMVMLDHVLSHELMQKAADPSEPLKRVYEYLSGPEPQQFRESFGAVIVKSDNDKDDKPRPVSTARHHELGQPMAIYDWELGLHTVLLAVERFFSTQQFDEALEVARLVFDSTTDSEMSRFVTRQVEKVTVVNGVRKKDMVPETRFEKLDGTSCWRFPPFQDIARRIAAEGKDSAVDLDSSLPVDIKMALLERRSHGALVHATARGRPQAYMKWIVMKYAEILIASGDVHFRRGTMESLPLATQRYVEAAHVLGPEPPKIPQLVSKKKAIVLTFQTYDSLSKKEVLNDLGLPFSAELTTPGAPDASTTSKLALGMIRSPYFCVPINPKFKEMRSMVHTRLHNLRNSLDIDGRPVTYSLLEPPIDPGALMSLSKQGVGMSEALGMVMASQDSPLPRHRFETLLYRAQELVGELRSLGERLLSAIERKEGEILNVLRAKHTTTVSNMMLGIKQLHLLEAQQTVDSLKMSRESQVSQLAFYLRLIGEDPKTKIPTAKDSWEDIKQDIDTPTQDDLRMSSYEKMEMDLASKASALNLVASAIDGLIAPLCVVPQIETKAAPMGVGAGVSVGGANFAAALQAGSAAVKMTAMVVGDEGGRAGRKAGMIRQLQERRLQANIRGREIKSIDKQIELQQVRIRVAEREMDMQNAELEEAKQMEEWYRSKYTNEQLYGWMEKGLRTLYFQAYNLALSAARRAENSLSFEQGRSVSVLKPGGYWDASRDGLLAADHLWADLKRLELAYTEASSHDYSITKTVSLRQIDPLALLRLRLTGSTTFSLSESLFDIDFPGHYMRRLRSVAVSIPAVVGPHSGVNATLTLLGHKYRVAPNVTTGADYRGVDRSAFRFDRVPISSVAISSGSHDTGVFELSFSGHKYMPFEGAGAISDWRLELPTEIRKFNYETIGDVVLHLQYTASEGGAGLRKAANESVRMVARSMQAEGASEGFWAMWDLKNDFVNEWYNFDSTVRQSPLHVRFKLGNLKERLPFWSRRQRGVEVRSVSILSKSDNLVNGLVVDGVTDGSGEATKIGDKCHVKTWANLAVKSLEGWELKAGETKPKTTAAGTVTASLLEEKEELQNVWLLVGYVFV